MSGELFRAGVGPGVSEERVAITMHEQREYEATGREEACSYENPDFPGTLALPLVPHLKVLCPTTAYRT